MTTRDEALERASAIVDALGEGWRVDVEDLSDIAGYEEYQIAAVSDDGRWRVYDNTCTGRPLFRAIPEPPERCGALDMARIPAASNPITALLTSRQYVTSLLRSEIDRLREILRSLSLPAD